MNCDLHTHTVHSDGSYSTSSLVALAKEKNLIIALTDHNTVSGLPEFLAEADRLGVNAVGGIELTTVYEGKEFHLIGLFISPDYYDFLENMCLDYHKLKEKSNIDLINRLNALGYDLDFAKIQKRNVHGRINRAHVADELVAKGYVKSIREAFDSLLEEEIGLYIPPKRLELTEGIKILRSIHAVPILAHPLMKINCEQLRDMLPELIKAGLVAIETMHPSYSEEDIVAAKKIVKEYGILESGGSDFHGDIKPGVELGVGKGNLSIPDTVYYDLKKFI